MKSIAVFNNKGGVGKTTLLCNLAAYLQKKLARRVLVIDADPQCNATSYMINMERLVNDLMADEPFTIQRVFAPVQEGEGFIDKDSIPIRSSVGFEVDVIQGDPRLSMMEDFLSSDWFDAKNGEPRGLKTTFLLKDLLLKLGERYDYIFFDVGPSLGAINRAVLMACDYFIMPMSTDIFCLQAVSNIAESITKWKIDLNKGIADYENKRCQTFCIGEQHVGIALRFLGYVSQQYVAKTVGGVVRPVKAYERIINQMPSRISEKLSDFYPADFPAERLKMGSIPNFNSLIPLSQLANKPIFSLVGTDGVVGAHFSKVKEFESVMAGITDSLIHNIADYD